MTSRDRLVGLGAARRPERRRRRRGRPVHGVGVPKTDGPGEQGLAGHDSQGGGHGVQVRLDVRRRRWPGAVGVTGVGAGGGAGTGWAEVFTRLVLLVVVVMMMMMMRMRVIWTAC